MTTQQFFDKYNGKAIDFDGFYGNQCMDLAEEYNRQVVLAPRLTGNAADVWTNYPKDYYEKIPNTPTGVPQKGDIIIWNRNTGGGYGHIAVFSEGDTNGFTSFDQNWPTGSLCHFQTHDYKNVYGWLRPKKTTSSGNVEVDNTTFERLVRKSTTYDKIQQKLNVADNETVILAEIDKLITFEDAVRQKDKLLENANDEIQRLQEEVKKLKEDHDVLSAENQKLVIKTDEQQTKMEGLAKEALARQDTIDDQGDMLNDLQSQLDALKKNTKAPLFKGWKKLIYDLLLSS